MARPKSTSKLISINKVYPPYVCNGIDNLTSMSLIPDDNPTPGELGMVEGICDAWAIAAFWIAYNMMPVVDIGRPPYIYKEFRQYQSWAKVLYAHQKLCVGCKENERNGGFDIPFWRWFRCMEEIKLGHFFFALSPPKPEGQTHFYPEGTCFPGLVSPPAYGSKPYFNRMKMYFYQSVCAGIIPDEISKKPDTNTAKLYKDAHFLAFEWRSSKRTAFKTQYWDPLVSSYKDFLDDLKKWPASQMPSLQEQKRFVQDRGRKKYIPYPKLENIAANEVVTITYKRWSDYGVYVPACIISNI